MTNDGHIVLADRDGHEQQRDTGIYFEQNSSWKQGYKSGYDVGAQTAVCAFYHFMERYLDRYCEPYTKEEIKRIMEKARQEVLLK